MAGKEQCESRCVSGEMRDVMYMGYADIVPSRDAEAESH